MGCQHCSIGSLVTCTGFGTSLHAAAAYRIHVMRSLEALDRWEGTHLRWYQALLNCVALRSISLDIEHSFEQLSRQAYTGNDMSMASDSMSSDVQELAKTGQLRRSIEIFDWLRGLEDGHELAPLADVYTYTTSISQCGSHQQLRRALELVAEMRSRGIPCNVHTYRQASPPAQGSQNACA